jgi:hypothetical protein
MKADNTAQRGGFDPRIVHIRDPRTGRVKNVNSFRVKVEGGVRYYEWPKFSGNLWYEDRTPAGRWEEVEDAKSKSMVKKVVIGAGHKEYVAPLTDDQKLTKDILEAKAENEKLKQELAAIKAEAEKVSAKVENAKPAKKKPEESKNSNKQ